MEQHGETLLCVRFRYDEELWHRMKTVELIVEGLTGYRLHRDILRMNYIITFGQEELKWRKTINQIPYF